MRTAGCGSGIAAPVGAAVVPCATPGTGGTNGGVRYTLMIQKEGAPGQDALHAKLVGPQKGFKSLEH